MRRNASQPASFRTIRVEGNQRIEEGTIRSYMLVRPGDPFDPDRLDRSLKTLYATGLFSDVSLRRDGDTLVVKVVENPIVNRIAFEGNHKLNDDKLRAELQLRPRAVFTPALAAGRPAADPRPVRQARPLRRARSSRRSSSSTRTASTWCSRSHEGDATLISRIAFVGNHAFSEGRLRDVDQQPRGGAGGASCPPPTNTIPDRVNFDKELLRRFYLKNGYADFEVTDATAELAPDRKAFFLTFTLNEGERYRIGKVSSRTRTLPQRRRRDRCTPVLEIAAGDWYDGDAVERTAAGDDRRRAEPRLCASSTSSRASRATARSTPSTSSSTSPRGRASMSSASTSSATRAPRTR